jgi:hypothetical protein
MYVAGNKLSRTGVHTSSMDLLPRNGWFVGLRRIGLSRFALFTFAVLFTGLMGCIAHNLFLREQAAAMLRDLQQLRPGSSPMSEVRTFAAKYHLEKSGSCTESDCDFSVLVYEDRGIWMLISAAQDSHIPTTIVDELRVRRWSLRPWLRVQNGTLMDLEVCIFVERSFPDLPYLRWGWHRVCTRFEIAPPNYVSDSSVGKMLWERTPGYLPIRLPKEFRVYLDPEANASEVKRAFQYNLRCLIGGQPCRSYADIAPEAWADYCQVSPPDCQSFD